MRAMLSAAKGSWIAGGNTPGVSSTNTRGFLDICMHKGASACCYCLLGWLSGRCGGQVTV